MSEQAEIATCATAFQVKTGLSDAMSGLGDELEEIKGRIWDRRINASAVSFSYSSVTPLFEKGKSG